MQTKTLKKSLLMLLVGFIVLFTIMPMYTVNAETRITRPRKTFHVKNDEEFSNALVTMVKYGPKIILDSDIETSQSYTINQSVIIDLNGHSIKVLTENSDYNASYFLFVKNDLTIIDSSEAKTGEITRKGKAKDIFYDSCIWCLGGEVRLESGTISNWNFGVYVGTHITGDNENVKSNFVMTGGKITKCQVGVMIKPNNSFTMTGGEIKENIFPSANNKLDFLGYDPKKSASGVFAHDGATVNLLGGDITQNKGGGVVFYELKKAGSFTIGGQMYIDKNYYDYNRPANILLGNVSAQFEPFELIKFEDFEEHFDYAKGISLGTWDKSPLKGKDKIFICSGVPKNKFYIHSDNEDVTFDYYDTYENKKNVVVARLTKQPLEGKVSISKTGKLYMAAPEYNEEEYGHINFKYRWQFAYEIDYTWKDIKDATGQNYMPGEEDPYGGYLRVIAYDDEHYSGELVSEPMEYSFYSYWDFKPTEKNYNAVIQMLPDSNLEPNRDCNPSVKVILCENGNVNSPAIGSKSYRWYDEDGVEQHNGGLLSEATYYFTKDQIGKKLYCVVTYNDKEYTTDLIGPVEKITISCHTTQDIYSYIDRINIKDTWPGADYLLVPSGSAPDWENGITFKGWDNGYNIIYDLEPGTEYNLYYKYDGDDIYKPVEETLCPETFYTKDLCLPGQHDIHKVCNATEPSCTEAGSTEYYYCFDCHKYYSDDKGENEIEVDSWIIPPSHKWEVDYAIDKEATCTEEGSKSIHCSECDAKKDTVKISKTAHKDIDNDGKCDGCGCDYDEATTPDTEPVDPTPVDPTPVDPTPVDPTPVDPTPVDPTPVDPTPVDPTPVDPTPEDVTPEEKTPDENTPEVEPTAVAGQKIDISDSFDLSTLTEGQEIAGYRIKDKNEKKIATVNNKGRVTPKKSGVVHIWAYIMSGKEKVDVSTIEVTVIVPTFDKNAMKANFAGQTVSGNIVLSDYDAAAKNQTVVWKSSKSSVATVDETTGLITALKSGKTTISVSFTNNDDKTVTKKALFTVKIPKLNVKDAIKLKNGKSKKLSVSNIEKTDAVTWTSSDDSVVSIVPNGKKAKIKALATGTAEITATVNGHNYKTTVTVH